MKKRKRIRRKLNFSKKHQIIFALFVGISVVAFWRGVWGLMDLYLFPDNQTISFMASLVMGLCILVASHYVVKELIGD